MSRISIHKDLLEHNPDILIPCDHCKKSFGAKEISEANYLGDDKSDMAVVQMANGEVHYLYNIDLDFIEDEVYCPDPGDKYDEDIEGDL